MKRLVIIAAAVLAVALIGGGIWGLYTDRSRTCDIGRYRRFDTNTTYVTPEIALKRLGRFPDLRETLPEESLVPTDEVSPTFGATLNHEFQANTPEGLVYDIWKDGVIVQTVVLDTDGPWAWEITGYGVCDPIQ
jgi:hypothetical protein